MGRVKWMTVPENMKTDTVYIQGDSAREFEYGGYCDACLRPANEWAEEDRFGNYEVYGAFDSQGNLIGFLCPQCAVKKK
ncbi:hypothetical protein JCM39194_00340 [Desulfotomaculum varum]|nr:hypothetical protein [Bacillota bacterium]